MELVGLLMMGVFALVKQFVFALVSGAGLAAGVAFVMKRAK